MVGIGGHIQCGVDSPAPYGLSADGSTIVGTQGDCAIRWTAADGWSALSSGARPVAHGACARAASADGSVVVGYHWQECPVPIICFDLIRAASRWPVGGFNLGGGWALGVSADGSTVVGFGCSEAFGCQAVRWTAGEEMIGLGTLPGDDAGTAHDITADGSVVVGETGVLDILVSRVSHPSAVRWTADEGTVALGDLPGVPYTRALGVSEEGQRIVGEGWVEDDFSRYSDAAFVWDPENGMRRLEDVLTQDYSLDLKGFTLMGATGISDDGSVIVGYGRDGEGPLEGWVVPEPGESLLFVTGSLVLLGAARRRA